MAKRSRAKATEPAGEPSAGDASPSQPAPEATPATPATPAKPAAPAKAPRSKKPATPGTSVAPGTPGGQTGEGRPGGSRPATGGDAAPGLRPVSLDPVVRAIENVRRLRVRTEPRRTVSDVVMQEQERLAKVQKSMGGVEAEWEQVVPPHLRERCWVRGVARRVLTIGVDDASMGYEMSMWLRGGGERALCAATGHKVSKVKVEVVATRPSG